MGFIKLNTYSEVILNVKDIITMELNKSVTINNSILITLKNNIIVDANYLSEREVMINDYVYLYDCLRENKGSIAYEIPITICRNSKNKQEGKYNNDQ